MSPITLDYPFPAAPLSIQDFEFVNQTLATAEHEFGLFAKRPSLRTVAAVFLRHCSPPDPGQEALRLMSRLLHIVLHFNDRMDPATTSREADGVWHRLASPSDAPGSDTVPVFGAARCVGRLLAQAMASRPGDIHSFLHLFRINLASFVWACRQDVAPVTSVDDHLVVRSETISAVAFLRMWGLLLGLSRESQLLYGLPLQTLERLSARVQALANDLKSVQRDAREGQGNVVALLAPNDPEAGVKLALALHDHSLAQLVVSSVSLLNTVPPDDVVRYVQFVQICTRGNNAAMAELSQRYS